MESLIEQLPDAIFVLGDDGGVRFANRAGRRLLGRDGASVTGEPLPFILADGDQLDFAAPDGPRRLLARTATVTWEEAPARLLCLRIGRERDSLDLEDRVATKLEEFARATVTLRRKEAELKRVKGELERFVYFASHDLKSPLRAVDSLASWIEEDLQDTLEGDTANHLRLLRSRIKRMDRLLDDILVYSRAGRNSAQPEPVDCGKLVRDLRLLLHVPDGIVIEADPSLPTVVARRGLLLQVLHNLVGNAVKHHDGPPGLVRVGAGETEEAWSFWVEDDGPGIDPQFHDRVFGMFRTLRRRDEVEGSGMGLALVRKIVEQEGGRIVIASGAGRGTCFRFTWPKTPGSLKEAT